VPWNRRLVIRDPRDRILRRGVGRYSRPMLPVTVDPASGTPPFEQLRRQVAAMVAEGTLSPGTRMPTVRQLAADLGLAANTVARAYRELETDGVIATHGRKGTFVRSPVVDPDATSDTTAGDRARAAADAYVASVRALGLGVTEATRLVELAWSRD
jgi:DNA-binding transcriptional regulator YhcF (GntR family)